MATIHIPEDGIEHLKRVALVLGVSALGVSALGVSALGVSALGVSGYQLLGRTSIGQGLRTDWELTKLPIT